MNLLLCLIAIVSSLPQNSVSRNHGDTALNMNLTDVEKQDEILSKRQLSERPDWMRDLMPQIKKLRLHKIAIPGSHNAGMVGGGLYSDCQSGDIFNQLNKGIRWFDLRIDRRLFNNGIVFSHGGVKGGDFYPQLDVIKKYLQQHSSEFVILHVIKDDGKPYYPEAAQKLKDVFGTMIATKAEYQGYNLENLLAKNRRVLITGDYAPEAISNVGSWGITQSGNWGTVVTKGIQWLKNEALIAMEQVKITSLSAAVTPKFGEDISAPRYVAPKLNALLKTEIEKLTIRINVIEHDFVDQALINAVIDHNKKTFA